MMCLGSRRGGRDVLMIEDGADRDYRSRDYERPACDEYAACESDESPHEEPARAKEHGRRRDKKSSSKKQYK